MKAARFRLFAPALVGAVALVAAGCGGGGGTSGSGSPSGASLVRSGALAFVSADSDTGSSQWHQLDALTKKFPSRDLALQGLKAQLAKQGVDYEKDVKPALGPEVDVAVVGGASAKDTAFAFLTKPADGGKFEALVKKLNASDTSGKPAVWRKTGDWYAVAESQAMIDRVLAPKGGKTLAEDDAFKSGLSKLPGDALVKAVVNVKAASSLLKQAARGSGTGPGSVETAVAKLDSVSASLSAENDGVRVHGATVGQGAAGAGDYTSKLLAQAPGDALAFLTFRGGGLSSPSGAFGSMLQLALGITPQELAQLFQGENGLWARPGALIPEVTAILQPNDTQAGLATLDKLARRLARSSSARFKPGAERTLDFQQFAIRYGAAAGRIVITNATGGVGSAGSSGEKLPASADFKDAKAAAGLPDSNAGFVYVDLKNAIPLIEGAAGLSGSSLPATVTQNLRPLRSFLAWSAGSGDAATFDAFLEIK